jgi:BirA family biotin operon repressor/biotin-[acetyl-CoA-carboxylase] ligase
VRDALLLGEIKWPNDIFYSGRKLCGILTEIVSSGSDAEKVIVGIGLNVNNTVPPEGVSLREINGEKGDPKKLLSSVVSNFEKYVSLDLGTILRRYRQLCATIGKDVTVKTLSGTHTGKAIDIDDEGNLVVETASGIVRCTEGETTLRPA